jgi:hypothetical protein
MVLTFLYKHLKLFKGEPEMDAFMWVSRADAKKMVFKSQKFIFEPGYLEKKLKAVGKSLSSS